MKKTIIKILKDKRGFIDPIVGGAIISGIANIAGGLGSTAASAKATKEAQAMQIAWERERAQNAHQWEIQDLKAAGLNPILSAGGSGAQTGGISAPVPDTSGLAAAGNSISNTINTAMGALAQKQQIQNNKALEQNTKADTLNKAEQAKNIQADTILKMTESGLISEQKAKTMLEQQELKYRVQFAPELLESQRQMQYANSAASNAEAKLKHDMRLKLQAEINKLEKEKEMLKQKLNLPENRAEFAKVKWAIDLLKGWL